LTNHWIKLFNPHAPDNPLFPTKWTALPLTQWNSASGLAVSSTIHAQLDSHHPSTPVLPLDSLSPCSRYTALHKSNHPSQYLQSCKKWPATPVGFHSSPQPSVPTQFPNQPRPAASLPSMDSWPPPNPMHKCSTAQTPNSAQINCPIVLYVSFYVFPVWVFTLPL